MFDNDVILGSEEESGFLFPEQEAQQEEADVAENAQEHTSQEQQEEPVETQQSQEIKPDILSEINGLFNSNYSSVEELKSALNANTKADEESALKQQFLDLEAKHNKLIEAFKTTQSPLDYFSDELEVKKNALIKGNPSINKEVAGKIFSIDLQKDNPLDIIALDMMLSSKVFKSGEDAKTLFLKQHGIEADFDVNDLDRTQQLAIDLAAEKAAQNIEAMRSSVQLPQGINVEEILKDVTYKPEPEYDITPWNDKIKPLVDSIKDFEVKDEKGNVLFVEIVDDEFKQGLDEVVAETIKAGKMQPTEENINSLKEEAFKIYKMENFDRIARRIVAQVEAREADKYHKMIHNDTDPDKRTHTPPSTGKTTNLLDLWGLPK